MSVRSIPSLRRSILVGVVILLAALLSCSDEEKVTAPTSPEAPARPRVVSVQPVPDDVVDLVVDTIRIVFSKQIDTSTISDSSIVITPPLTTRFEYDSANMTVIIVPTQELVYGRGYRVTVTDSLRDVDGLSLLREYQWGFRVRGVSALYVAPGGTGDGSQDNPLGSIQQAVDSTESDPALDVIFVAVGRYDGSIKITDAMTIYGGRDPLDEWRRSETDSTLIMGGSYQNQSIAMYVEDIPDTLRLNDLIIISTSGAYTGAGSYGIVCISTEYVTLTGCTVRSGCGAPGRDGVDGVAGWDATDASPARGGAGGKGGYEEGGYTECDSTGANCRYMCGTIYPPTDGQQGWSYDGTQTGGAGGTSGGAGFDGAPGAQGTDGEAGTNVVYLDWNNDVFFTVTGDGTKGTNGGYGSGGGGTSGAYAGVCYVNHPAEPGPDGGAGGAGAGRGTAGTAGTCGGSSIGVLTYHASVMLYGSTIISCTGGYGGNGGTGGAGGTGQPGKPGEPGPYPGLGAPGGNGGDGGRGGHGGGGAGGGSVAVAMYEGSFQLGADSRLITGQPGHGGFSAGNAGEDGVAAERYMLDLGPQSVPGE